VIVNVQGPKRRHHFLPRYYLNGFSEKAAGHFIWEYRRGLPFHPGHVREKHNPCKVGTRRQAGVVENFYAFKDIEGEVRLEDVENALEKLEKPIVEVMDKVRCQRRLDVQEKSTLAEYVFLIRQRVHSRAKRASDLMERAMAGFNWDLLQRKAAEEGRFDLARRLAFDRGSMVEDMRRELLVRGTLFRLTNVIAALAAMTWQFVVTDRDRIFVTSDDPVFFPEDLGLNKERSFLLFPVSSHVALVASWIQGDDLAFYHAPEDLIASINGVTLQRAQTYAYGARSEPWIAAGLVPEAESPAG